MEAALDLPECQAACLAHSECKYIYHQPASIRPWGDWCHLYSSCSRTWTPDIGGTNYAYECTKTPTPSPTVFVTSSPTTLSPTVTPSPTVAETSSPTLAVTSSPTTLSPTVAVTSNPTTLSPTFAQTSS